MSDKMGSTNDDDSLEPFYCYFCTEKFYDVKSLRNHIEVIHLSLSNTADVATSTITDMSINENVKIVNSNENIESFNNNKKLTKKRNKNSEKDKSVLVDKSKNNDKLIYFGVDNDNVSNDAILG